jgi:hypothetical protein
MTAGEVSHGLDEVLLSERRRYTSCDVRALATLIRLGARGRRLGNQTVMPPCRVAQGTERGHRCPAATRHRRGRPSPHTPRGDGREPASERSVP